MACILLLFIGRATRFGLRFMAYPPVILFFTVPLTIPEVTLFYHEPLRTETFKTASLVWIIGMDVPAVFTVLRIFAVHRVIGKYAGCTAGHILAVYDECKDK